MKLIRKLIYPLLESPTFFNLMQGVIADQTHVKRFVRQAILEYKPKSVLDIGFGTGNFMETIPPRVQYLGIDNNPSYVSYVRGKHLGGGLGLPRGGTAFLLRDANDPKIYKKNSYDIVLLISILHHLSDHELAHILPFIKRAAKKAIIIADIIPNPPGIVPKTLVKLDRGQYVRTREEKLRLLRKYFKVVEVRDIPQGLAVQLGIICEK